MEQTAPHPRVLQFEQDCAAAGLTPLDVLSAAGLHRSAWFRWKGGKFAPNLKSLERVQSSLEQMKRGRAA